MTLRTAAISCRTCRGTCSWHSNWAIPSNSHCWWHRQQMRYSNMAGDSVTISMTLPLSFWGLVISCLFYRVSGDRVKWHVWSLHRLSLLMKGCGQNCSACANNNFLSKVLCWSWDLTVPPHCDDLHHTFNLTVSLTYTTDPFHLGMAAGSFHESNNLHWLESMETFMVYRTIVGRMQKYCLEKEWSM